jgi:hypothetical protein
MIKLVGLLLIFSSFKIYGQDTIYLIEKKYTSSKNIAYTASIPLVRDSNLNLTLIKNQVQILKFIPDTLTSISNKHKMRVSWWKPEEKKSLRSNYYFKNFYNENGLLVYQLFSGCGMCKQFTYTLEIKYNELNQPVTFTKHFGDLMNDDLIKNVTDNEPVEQIEINYNSRNEIEQIEYYLNKELNVTVDIKQK